MSPEEIIRWYIAEHTRAMRDLTLKDVSSLHRYEGTVIGLQLALKALKDTVNIKGIWLLREGECAVVQAWMSDGTYKEVIREHLDGNFSHCVHAEGIRKATTT